MRTENKNQVTETAQKITSKPGQHKQNYIHSLGGEPLLPAEADPTQVVDPAQVWLSQTTSKKGYN